MKNNTTKKFTFSEDILNNTVTYIQSVEIANKANKDKKSKLESLITIYLDECLKYVKTQKLETKNGLPYSYNATVTAFKSDLLKAINPTLKELNINEPSHIAFNIFNKAMKKAPEKLLLKLRLMDFMTIKKFSELTPSAIKGLNFANEYIKIKEDINEAYKAINEAKIIEAKKASLEKKGYTVSN